MKISIIGTNGFLSSAIGKYANSKGYPLDMYGLDAPVNHRYDHFHKVNLMTEDVNYSALLASDMIVYASGAGVQSNLMEGADLVYGLNVTVPIRMCNNLKLKGYKGVFVSFGSFFEMGETHEERFFNEEDILSSTYKAPNDYTVSKRILTRFVESYSHEFTHWHFFIPTIYGENENPKRLIPYTIDAIRNGEDLHFTAGDQTRQYIHVREIPEMLDMAFGKNLTNGLYAIEGSDTLTVKEIVTLIHDIMGKKVPDGCFGSTLRADVGMKYLALDGTKLRNAIGFEAKKHIKDILLEMKDKDLRAVYNQEPFRGG